MENRKVLRGYELQDLIGEGGFGAVYRAYQAVIEREVAIKIILPHFANQPDFIRKFEYEAKLVARLEHPHIVPLYDFWRDPEGAYLVMRWLRGGSLTGLIKQGPLSAQRTAQILDQVAGALNVAHRNGIVHRDIKPDNVLLDEEGNAFLSDFGIAKDLSVLASSQEEDSIDEGITGSPAYFSPEQAMGDEPDNPVSPRSDIYSLGIMVFEMLTGRKPFEGGTLMQMIFKQINEPIPSLQTIDPELPIALDNVIQRATTKDPRARYPYVASMAAEFRQALNAFDPFTTATAMEIPSGMLSVVDMPTQHIKLDVTVSDLVVGDLQNPYKGLRPFSEADAKDFYGRETLIQHLLSRLEEDGTFANFLAVIGPSGSGKSSVVKAGMLPALRDGAIAGSNKWFLAEMIPSSQPFQELESALLSVAIGPQPNLMQMLRQDEYGLLNAMNQILTSRDSQLLLVIDQFEELFTLVEDEATRSAFLNNVLVAMTNPNSRLKVIVTLRADFYDRPLQYPGFGELIRKRSEVVLPLSATEMESAIVKPAERVGMQVEPALVSAIIAEVTEQPGALPLLQYALTEVFERREGDTLTLKAYQESGGVLGALARRAEELYRQLTEPKQEIVRQVFLRLVTLGEGVEDTRRRAYQGDLLSIGENKHEIQEVLDLYSKYRLLTNDTDPLTRHPTIEVAHEALIREWKRLQEWLRDSRDDVRVQQRLSNATQEWLNQRRDHSFLASGIRLEQFEALLTSENISLSEDEKAYARASIAERERQEAEEAERMARERALEQRSRRILTALVAVFVVAAIIASILALFAFNARSDAVEARDVAEENEALAQQEAQLRATAEGIAVEQRDQALIETSRALSILALQQLTLDPAASVDLGLRALPSEENLRPYIPEAEFALAQAMQISLERAISEPFDGNSITTIAFGNEQMAVVGRDLLLMPYDLQETLLLSGHNETIIDAAWSTTQQLLSYDPTLVNVWENDRIRASFAAPEGMAIGCATWQGRRVAICLNSTNPEIPSTVQLWEPDTNETITSQPFQMAVNGIQISPDNTLIAAWDNATVIVWNPEVGETFVYAPDIPGHTLTGITWSSNSNVLAISLSDFTARYWQFASEEATALTGHNGAIDGLLFIDDERLATWGDDGTVRIWSPSGENILTLETPPASNSEVNGIALSPEKTKLLVWQNNGVATLWDLTTGGQIAPLSGQTNNILNVLWRDETFVLTSDVDFDIKMWDSSTGLEVTALYGHQNRVKGMQWLNSNQLLSYGQDGSIRLWEVFNNNQVPMGHGLIYDFSGHRGEIRFAAWIDDNTVITAGRDGTARRWSLDTGQVEILEADRNSRLVWNPNGTRVLVYQDDGAGQVWDFETKTVLYDIQGPIGVGAAIWLDIGLIIGAPDGQVAWLDDDGNVRAILQGHTARINDAQFFSESRRLATAGSDNQILIWRLPPESSSDPLQPLITLASEGRQPLRVTWNRDGTRLLSAGFNGDVSLWDVQRQEVLLFLTGDRNFPSRDAAVFSPNEDYFAAPIDDEIFVWNLDGQLIFRTTGDNAILGVRWVMQGERLRLLSWSLNNLIQVWDIPSGVEVLRLRDENGVLSASFNSNASLILSAGRSGKLRIWQAWQDTNTLIDTANICCHTRQLSDAELANLSILD